MGLAEAVGVDAEVVEQLAAGRAVDAALADRALCTAISRCGVPQPVGGAAVFCAKCTYQVWLVSSGAP